jgi:hypothetical protein
MKKIPPAAVFALLLAGVASGSACRGSEQESPAPPPTVAATLAPLPAATPAATPEPTLAIPPPATIASAPATPHAQPSPTPPPPRPAQTAPPVAPTPAPTATPPHDHSLRVAAILASAQAALAGGDLKQAATLFGDALALDPDNAAARKGKAFVNTTLLGQTRTFVPDLASSEGAEGRIKKMEGFDDVEERNVRRAVKVPGRAELDSSPAHIKPGEPYRVDIFLRNLSTKKKKNIRVSNVAVKRIVNDKETRIPVDWKPILVEPRQRALVATVSGNWEDDVSSWILDVKLLAEETNDIYENRVVWK